MENAEGVLLGYTGIPGTFITTEYIEFEHRGIPVRIRTVRITEKKEKPTLVFCHGNTMALAINYLVFKPLFEHYNLVLLDMLNWGLSTRVAKLPDHVND